MGAEQKVSFRLVRCKERSFETKLVSGKKYPEKFVAFQFSCRIEPVEQKQISFVINVFYTVEDQEVFRQETETIFELDPIEQAIEFLPKGIVDHVNIIPTLLGISYSSTRGMIAIRTAGTGLEYYPAPVVDAAEIAKQMSKTE